MEAGTSKVLGSASGEGLVVILSHERMQKAKRAHKWGRKRS
jgi:hypothetical protein